MCHLITVTILLHSKSRSPATHCTAPDSQLILAFLSTPPLSPPLSLLLPLALWQMWLPLYCIAVTASAPCLWPVLLCNQFTTTSNVSSHCSYVACLCGIAINLAIDTWWCCCCFQCSICCCDAVGIAQPC